MTQDVLPEEVADDFPHLLHVLCLGVLVGVDELECEQLEDDILQVQLISFGELLQKSEELGESGHFNQLVAVFQVALQEQQDYLTHFGGLAVLRVVKVQAFDDVAVWFEHLLEVSYESAESVPEYVLVVAPDGADERHSRLSHVDTRVQQLLLIFRFVDNAQLVEARVDSFEQQVLLVYPVLLDLKVVRQDDVVDQIEVVVHGLSSEVLWQDYAE